MNNPTVKAAPQWHDFVRDDRQTWPRDRKEIMAEFWNGAQGQALFDSGQFSLLEDSAEITGGTDVKRWHYLNRP